MALTKKQRKRKYYQDRKELSLLIKQQRKESYYDNRHSIYGVNSKTKVS